MTATEVAVLITAVTGLLTGIFTAIKVVGGQKQEATTSIVSAYKSIVDSLQEEVKRLQSRNDTLEKANEMLEEALDDFRAGAG